MVDEDIIQRISDLFGTRMLGPYGPYGKSKQATYTAQCSGQVAVELMIGLLPLMGLRRAKKIEEVLDTWEERQIIDPTRVPKCCPDKEYFAKDYCRQCYMKAYHKQRKAA